MGGVPAGATHDEHGVPVGRQEGGELLEQRLGGFGAGVGHDQRPPVSRAGQIAPQIQAALGWLGRVFW